jgi:phosphohistidine phosphatase
MTTLFLLRHAKSSWDDPTLDDHDRPLSARGQKVAPLIGDYMHQQGWRPQVILCSTARRTVDTLMLMRPYLGLRVPVMIEPGLYHAEADTLMARLKALGNDIETALLVGHNPGLEDMLALVADASLSEVPLPEKYPTGGLAVLNGPATGWRSLGAQWARLAVFVEPKSLGANHA